MTLYQKINRACELGKYPIIKSEGFYKIISPIKNKDGHLRTSSWTKTVEEASLDVGVHEGVLAQGYELLDNAELIGYYYPPFEGYKVGDKVKIRQDLEKSESEQAWNKLDNDFKSTAGFYGQVVAINNQNNIYVVEIDELDYKYKHDQLEPSFEDDTIEIGGSTYVTTPEFLEQVKKLKKIK